MTRLGDVFCGTGSDYDRYRPGFPAAALDVAVPAPVAALLDLGAGTGKLTERLTERARSITAVDPSAQMLAVLRTKLPSVTALVGSAEAIPVAASSQDIVAAAQAFHWFDREAACAQIARVRRPGGTLVLMWNGPDPHCAWDLSCHEVAHPGSTAPGQPSEACVLPGFRLLRTADVPWTEVLSRQHCLRRWRTVSSFLAADAVRRAQMEAEVQAILDAHPNTRGHGMLRLPSRTWVEVHEPHGA